ncbi:MAG: hypothetical protein BWZ03_00416 [bacterium ADurb.BinA186]|nr:MAG: hypothetical protein BWZ03_00416 [bacterium ADurb.BinA186]
MSKYCPACKGEFHDGVQLCPKDQVILVAHLEEDDVLVDFYLAKDEIEAERIGSFLRSEGIYAHESDTGISQVPVVSDEHFVILVLKSERAEARKLIEQARKDHIISTEGSFI